jgi:hypothetical protein
MFSSQGLAGFPVGGLIFSFGDLASASSLWGLLGVPGPLGTFILLMPFLMTVGTVVSP